MPIHRPSRTRPQPHRVAALALAIGICGSAVAAEVQMTFEDVPAGQLPPGWKIDATHPAGALAVWKVEAGPGAHGGQKVLTLAESAAETFLQRIGIGDTFNLCWTPEVRFSDLDLEVAVRANYGRSDQGGGPIWRALDANNYYIARYNPLEHNFRVYYVKGGSRVQIASVENMRIETGEWFTVRIVHRGDLIQGFVNGVKLAEVRDRNFLGPGGIGLWTKSDAATSFDDIRVREPTP